MDIAGRSLFRHQAFVYRGEPQYVGGVAAFVAEGASADEAVLVAVDGGERTAVLREALEQYAELVEFADLARLGPNPGRLTSLWLDWAERNAASGRGFRGVCEPEFASRGAEELVELRRHERSLDHAFRHGPAWSLQCPFDAETVSAEVLGDAQRAHPLLRQDDGGVLESPDYAYPEPIFDSEPAAPLPQPADVTAALDFDAESLARVRGLVRSSATKLGLDQAKLIDFILVTSELATNSVRHGGGTGSLRLWRENGHAVCEVRDRGVITDPLVGLRPPDFRKGVGGAGLWAINRVCALVAIRTSPRQGTVVRAHLALAG
jgi:anti-sigma regulatory factor (Ser/Thr protein kinase)